MTAFKTMYLHVSCSCIHPKGGLLVFKFLWNSPTSSWRVNFKSPVRFICYFSQPCPSLLIVILGGEGCGTSWKRCKLQGSGLWRFYTWPWLNLLSVSWSFIMATASTSGSSYQERDHSSPHLPFCDRLKSAGILSQRDLSGILSNEHKCDWYIPQTHIICIRHSAKLVK